MTASNPSGGDELAAALERAATRVNRVTEHEPFSDQAYAALNGYISEYIRALTLESTSVARRQGSDVVSAKDVDRASAYLFSGSTRRGFTQYLGTIGGVLFGAALGNALNLMSVDHPSAASILVTAALAVLGSILISFNVARDFR